APASARLAVVRRRGGGVTIIHLGPALLAGSSGLPGGIGRAILRRLPIGLAPCGVWPATPVTGRAVRSYRTFSPLPAPPPPFGRSGSRRYVFCATFLRVAPTGDYPAHCPAEFGLSSPRPFRAATGAAAAARAGSDRPTRCNG